MDKSKSLVSVGEDDFEDGNCQNSSIDNNSSFSSKSTIVDENQFNYDDSKILVDGNIDQNSPKSNCSLSVSIKQSLSCSDDENSDINTVSTQEHMQSSDTKSSESTISTKKELITSLGKLDESKMPQRRRSSRIREKLDEKKDSPEVKKQSKVKKNSSASILPKNEQSLSSVCLAPEGLENNDSNSANNSNSSSDNVIILCDKFEDVASSSSDSKSSKTKTKRLRPKKSNNLKNEKVENKSNKSILTSRGKRKKSLTKSVADSASNNSMDNNLEQGKHSTSIDSWDEVISVVSSPEKLSAVCAKVLNPSDDSDVSVHQNSDNMSSTESSEVNKDDNVVKPVKVKSRWWRSSELEGVLNSPVVIESTNTSDEVDVGEQGEVDDFENVEMELIDVEKVDDEVVESETKPEIEESLKQEACIVEEIVKPPDFENINENIYRFERKRSKSKKEVRRMLCDCTLTDEEIEYGVLGCKEECLNRLLMIECGSRCPTGSACSNKKFKEKQYIKSETFKTPNKGWGLRALEDVSLGDFIMEFVGEVLRHKEYRQRVKQYAKDKNVHYYFMALKTDEIIDATKKGNVSRFINHSCDPNCETQKWTVNGELRIGLFARRIIQNGEELTIDYQFQRYGREAQKCYCGSDLCSGYIGESKQISIDSYGASKPATVKRKKGSDEKKRDWEDIILEEEIQKLNGNKGLRNRDETLRLARLMVRADDSHTRHQLLDIILKTEEQACLRLFLNFHGLSLIWSWMTDIVDKTLKVKILKVLFMLPIQNKTILLNSKVLNMVEKWSHDSSAESGGSHSPSKKSKAVIETPDVENAEPTSKKSKGGNLSDSETDSTVSPQNVDSNSSENDIVTDSNKVDLSTDNSTASDAVPKSQFETVTDQTDTLLQASTSNLMEVESQPKEKSEIANLSEGLLDQWKDLKEEFRIPRLEQQKINEDKRLTDTVLERPNADVSPKFSNININCDQSIPVIISSHGGSSGYTSPKDTDYNFTDKNQADVSALEPQQKIQSIQTLDMQKLSKQTRRHLFAMKVQNYDKEVALKKQKEDSSSESPSPILSTGVSGGSNISCIPPGRPPALHTITHFTSERPKRNYSSQPSIDASAPPPALTFPPPNMIYQQPPQIPFLGAPPPVLSRPPPNVSVPPKSSIPQNISLPQNSPFPPNVSLPQNIPLPQGVPMPQAPSLPSNMPIHQNVPQGVPQNTSLPSNVAIPQNNPLPQNIPLHQNTSINPNLLMPQTANLPQNQPMPQAVNMPQNIAIPQTTNIPQNSPMLQNMPGGTVPCQPIPNPGNFVVPPNQPQTQVHPGSTQQPMYIPGQAPPLMKANYASGQNPYINQGQQLYYFQQPCSNPSPNSLDVGQQPQTAIQQSPAAVEEKSPSTAKVVLPPNWRTATDSEGNVYYYHSVTRQTQWDPPTADQVLEEEDDDSDESSEDSDTPTYDEPKHSHKRKTKKAAADTSVMFPLRPDIAKKIKELFRTKISTFVIHCLNSYRKSDCIVGRITNNDDFKYLARKLTHYAMTKELKQCKNVEELDCNDCVKRKTRDFIEKYMAKHGSHYSRKVKGSPADD